MIFEPWFKSWIVAIVTSTLGLIAIIASQARDDFANFSILLGFVLLEVNLVLFFLLKYLKLLELNGELVLSIFTFAAMVMAIIGIMIGRFLGAWTPFKSINLPFSYYLWISFMITTNFFLSINSLITHYKSIRQMKQVLKERKFPENENGKTTIEVH